MFNSKTKKKKKTNYIFALAVVLAVIIAIGMAGSVLIDWNRYKPQIEAAISDSLGRKVAIRGEIGGMLLPITKITARDIVIDNIEGGKAPYMAQVAQLEVHVSPMALLSGVIDIGYVGLEKPDIYLEKLSDTKTNWQFGKPGAAAPAGDTASADGSGFDPGKIQLDDFKIDGGKLLYTDFTSGTEQRFEDVNLKASGRLGAKQASIDGSALWRGEKMSVNAAVKPEGSSGNLLAEAKIDSALGKASFNGHITDPSQKSKEFAATGEMNVELKTDPFILLDSKMTYAGQELKLQNAVLSIGGQKAQGDIAVKLGDTPSVDAKLSADTVNVDQLLSSVASLQDKIGTQRSAATSDAPQKSTAGLPVKGQAVIAVKSLQYKEYSAQNVRLQAATADGKNINIQRLFAQMPGDTSIEASGMYNLPMQNFNGRMRLESANVPQLAAAFGKGDIEWLKTQATRLELTSNLNYANSKVALNDYQLNYGDIKATGDAAYTMSAIPSIDLKIALRHPSLKKLAAQPTLPFESKVALDADITAQMKDGLAFNTLQGTAKTVLQDGVYNGMDLKKISLRLKDLNSLQDFLAVLDQSKQQGTTNIESVSADWVIAKGVANSQNIAIDSDVAKGKGSGTVDMGDMKLDIKNNISFVDHPKVPALGLRLHGDLKAPQKEFETAALASYFGQRALNKVIEKNVDTQKLQEKIDNKLGEKGGKILNKLFGQ